MGLEWGQSNRQSAVLLRSVVRSRKIRPSVSLSVRNVDVRVCIGSTRSKVITRIISLEYSHLGATTSQYAMPLKFRWNRGGVAISYYR